MIALITVALSATIAAPQSRVWRALTVRSERPIWDERILGEIALATTSCRRGGRLAQRRSGAHGRSKRRPGDTAHRAQWRYRLGGVPLVMREDLVQADLPTRLVTHVSIGSMAFDQTLTLHDEDDETGPRTRLGMKIVARNSIALLGEMLPRLEVQRLVIEYVDTTLRQVQKYCESGL
jgi:hypothetical protein